MNACEKETISAYETRQNERQCKMNSLQNGSVNVYIFVVPESNYVLIPIAIKH